MGAFSFEPTIVATSLAIPLWLRANALSGVTSISIALNKGPKISLIGVPALTESSKTIIPSCSSEIPNSLSEQIIPKLSTPLILALPILKSPGRTAPTFAKTIFWPASTFGAPQTTLKVSFPSETLQSLSLSASGCFSAFKTSPTTKLSNESKSVTTSDSKPRIVNLSAKSVAVKSKSTNLLSQCKETFIKTAPKIVYHFDKTIWYLWYHI